jgi:hypothetical protein
VLKEIITVPTLAESASPPIRDWSVGLRVAAEAIALTAKHRNIAAISMEKVRLIILVSFLDTFQA